MVGGDSLRLREFVQEVYNFLSNLPGNRTTGSREEQKAFDLLWNELEITGVKAEFIEFDGFSYEFGKSSLAILEEKEENYECLPYLGTKSGWDEIFDSFYFWDGDGDCGENNTLGENPILITTKKFDDRMGKVMKSWGIRGFIHVQKREEGELRYKRVEFQQKKNGSEVIGVTVLYDTGRRLIEKLRENRKIRITSQTGWRDVKSKNLIVNEEVLYSKNNAIVLTAHIDTVFGSPGIGDNGVACGILLVLCKEILKSAPDTNICFVWTSGEEFEQQGMTVLCERWKKNCAKIGAGIVLDVLGGTFSDDEIKIFGGEKLFIGGNLREYAEKNGWTVGEKAYGDAEPMVKMGIPVLSLHRFTGRMHCEGDDLTTITLEGIKKSFELVLKVMEKQVCKVAER